MDQSEDLRVAAAFDEPATVTLPDQPQARRLNGFAKVARQRISRNVASRPRQQEQLATLPPIEADTLPAPVARRAEAALLISAILELRPDLNGELSISTGTQTIIEADLLEKIDRIAAQTGGAADEHARIALINAIIRDWLMAHERVAQAAAR